MELKAFAERFVHRGRTESNLVTKWKAGSTLPSRSSAVMLEKHLPSTLHMFDLPLYELLGDRALPAHQVEDVITSLRQKVDMGWEWRFPGSPSGYYNALPNDSSALASRGDLWGFIAIVALVRQAEIQGDELSHLLLSMDMYRALPAALKLPWIAPSTELLQECVNSVRRRMPISAVMYDIDWPVIARHVADPNYEPGYERRIDPATRKTIEFEDPILEARLIRGNQARAQR
ncbi:hypothetical protein [Rhodanobacter panaciterrae]|uniref:hypothetical protein n=1 Tax=Rhodanobacter panaciterrae TaxID=490572 RepID=UPI00167357AA|nr:hypothetical protein [Rhodanobacter panaciterrae]